MNGTGRGRIMGKYGELLASYTSQINEKISRMEAINDGKNSPEWNRLNSEVNVLKSKWKLLFPKFNLLSVKLKTDQEKFNVLGCAICLEAFGKKSGAEVIDECRAMDTVFDTPGDFAEIVSGTGEVPNSQ